MRVRDFFDEYWSTPVFRGFDDLRQLLSSSSRYARSLLGDLRGKRILEIGPGAGMDLLHLCRSGGEVTGVDVSEQALRALRENVNIMDVRLCQMEACSLGFKRSSFDLVFLNTCLMHLDRRRLISQIRRVLKPGGRVVSIEPLKLNPVVFFYRSLLSPGRRLSPSYFGLEEISRLGKEFSEVRHREFYLISPLALGMGAVFPAFRKLIPLFESLDGLLLKALPPLRAWSWIVVMECRKEWA